MKNILKYIFLFLVFIMVSQSVFAQRNRWKQYNFKDSTALSPVDSRYADEDAVELKSIKIFEYKGLGPSTLQKTVYKLIRINTDIGLEDYNKVAIPMYGVRKIVDFKVRFISPNGKVTVMNQNDLYEIDNLEGYGDFKVFAIKGAEIGGEIEYKYTLNLYPSKSHIEIYYNDYPIQEGRFELVAHGALSVFIKSYNGFPELEVDSDGRQAWYADLKNVEPIKREKYTNNTPHRMKISYAIMGGSDATPFTQWRKKYNSVFDYCMQFSKSEKKKALKLYQTFPLSDASDEQKINYIKKYCNDSINITYAYTYAEYNLHNIIRYKTVPTTFGMLILQSALYEAAGIEYEILLTGDKTFTEFSSDYPFSYMVDKTLFYFPNSGQYLEPYSEFYPLGIVKTNYISQEAYFIKKSSGSYYQSIIPVDTSRSNAKYHIHLRLVDDHIVEINWQTHYKGYWAAQYRRLLSYLDKKERKEFLKEKGKRSSVNVTVHDSEIINDTLSWKDTIVKPLIFTYQLSSDMLIEKGADDLIFNLGYLFQTRSDLYKEEEERSQDIDMGNPIKKSYIIKVEIPENYQIANLEDLIEDVKYTNEEGEVQAGLASNYELNEKLLVYKVTEYFTKSSYPAADYEKIRTVINQMADLKYKSLVLQPTESSSTE
ncbi:DUF3857 domain-containing protein [Lentimicrobium sp. S6]|uniref:DUF3857 domain-containing protein n=1 Tax=Lentimicrobium sp. S6 TaxID=2735872 RepID=UPI0015556416|nr:DUF3857 domain-containing protein [Lentimicrobium sp. S6]NPD44017.1 DUF3857 domain-containing protein [Lentimicrobium sp. S6]